MLPVLGKEAHDTASTVSGSTQRFRDPRSGRLTPPAGRGLGAATLAAELLSSCVAGGQSPPFRACGPPGKSDAEFGE